MLSNALNAVFIVHLDKSNTGDLLQFTKHGKHLPKSHVRRYSDGMRFMIRSVAGQRASFHHRDVESAAVLRGVVPLEALAQATGFGRREGPTERGVGMRAELVAGRHDPPGVRLLLIAELLHEAGEADAPLAFGHRHMTPACRPS